MKYHVGISKVYFPKELHSKRIGEEFYEVWSNIKADSRSEAAYEVWRIYGNQLLEKMIPANKLGRKVSLHVDSPKAGVGGKLGRLIPVLVYVESA